MAAAILLAPAAYAGAQEQPVTTNFTQLVREKRYLELERALQSYTQLPRTERKFAEGILANRRNRIDKSIRLLRQVIPAVSPVNKEQAIIALSTLADDYEKRFDYAQAADTYAQLDQQFGEFMSATERARVRIEAARWNLLRGAPRQTINIDGPFAVPTTRDAVGLIEASIQIKGQSIPVILDSGANLCAIRKSTADQLGLKLSRGEATTKGIAGDSMSAHTTVIPEMRFGDATLHNVAAIVVPDKDLDVKQLNYRIPGSLGFPVLAALGKITFSADGYLGVNPHPAPLKYKLRNLFLERLTPLVAVRIGNFPHLFTIDTGSTGAFLSVQYYRKHKREFNGQAPMNLDLTGAGGSETIPSYSLPYARIHLGRGCLEVRDLPVLTQPRATSDDRFYGNLGQEVFANAHSFSFDFRNMAFTVDAPCTATRASSAGPIH